MADEKPPPVMMTGETYTRTVDADTGMPLSDWKLKEQHFGPMPSGGEAIKLTPGSGFLYDEIAQLKAQNAKLREALREVGAFFAPDRTTYSPAERDRCVRLILGALAEAGPEPGAFVTIQGGSAEPKSCEPFICADCKEPLGDGRVLLYPDTLLHSHCFQRRKDRGSWIP